MIDKLKQTAIKIREAMSTHKGMIMIALLHPEGIAISCRYNHLDSNRMISYEELDQARASILDHTLNEMINEVTRTRQ